MAATQKNESALLSKVWNIANVLSSAGVGFTDYITKPVEGRMLAKMILKYLPREKVEAVPDRDGSAQDGSASEVRNGQSVEMPGGNGPEAGQYRKLREAGLDPSVGLGYCQEDDALYLSLLEEYATGAEEKIQDLERYYDKEDWDNYAIVVHAVKSTSRMIGAAALADIAAGQEKAADTRDRGMVEISHLCMMALYGKVTTAIRSAIGYIAPADGRADVGDEEIMEFLPE